MTTTMLKAASEYQCPGCVNGSDPESCASATIGDTGCAKHCPGTMMMGAGTFALGLPKGFNRFGPTPTAAVELYESFESMLKVHPNLATKFSVPVWKHLDEHGNTITRWFSPRTNYGWSAVILGDCRDKMPGALDITAEDIASMD